MYMRLKNIRSVVAVMFATIAATTASAQIPQGYYDALKGKKGAELKTAVHNIIKKANVLSYGDGYGSTWYGFYTTDNDNGYVIDRYSNNRVKFGEQGKVPGGMNIEHSFPKSWWGGSKKQAYMDLFNLMPSDSKANSSKSNYGMGIVTQTSGKGFYDNGCIKVGEGSEGFKVWQPSLEWEGDFSRGYMYMATAYQDYTWSNNEAKNSLTQGDYPTLKKWAYELYIKWAKEDPVSQLEVNRNNAVYKIQGNRNPFIDFPNLMEYIWGDSVNYAFDPAKTVNSQNIKYDGGGSTDPDTPQPGYDEETIYTANYKSTDGNCTLELTKNPVEGVDVWTRSVKYGWTATGSVKGDDGKYIYNEAEGCLVLPEIDLTDYQSATMQFSHAVNYDKTPEARLSVEVRCDDNVTKLSGINWPAGNNWTYVNSGNIDLSQFAGKKIWIVFHYTSMAGKAGTWEVRDIAVKGTKVTTGIGCIGATTVNSFDPSAPYTVYDLAGRRINGIDAAKGIVIVKQRGKTFKMNR